MCRVGIIEHLVAFDMVPVVHHTMDAGGEVQSDGDTGDEKVLGQYDGRNCDKVYIESINQVCRNLT